MPKNTKGEQSKNKLIECAAELFMQKGYNATGISDILAGTGLPKGSFYFHFPSKKDLAVKVSIYYENKIGVWILNTAKGRVWEDFIEVLIGQMIEEAEGENFFGCPFAVLGLEIAFSEPDIAEYYSKSMKKLIDIFTSVLEYSRVPAINASAIANRAFAIYEGYLLYFRVSKDINVLRMMLTDLISINKS
ncbi:TetR/AcrR family transcriptional regulator [Clostridium akagii]|uniref:TetR/AcrR family transcriptional regulator n=1 Tax=Clostridium akagii TaxID=91623 RepID=UPI00047C0755|nr:TetR/AcrR family transcriptional regulator [Clostridium akagii]